MSEIISKSSDDIKYLYNRLENSVRDAIKRIMEAEFGADWELSYQVGFSGKSLSCLSERKKQFEQDYGLEMTKLVDYARLPEMVQVINQNRLHFDRVFQGSCLDLLNDLATVATKNFQDLTEDDKNKIFATSWLVARQMQGWNDGTKTKVLWYSADIAFDSYQNQEDSKKQAMEWFQRIKKDTTKTEESVHPNLGRVYGLAYKEGSVFLTNPIPWELNHDNRHIYSSRVRVMSQSDGALDHLLSLGGHSYWNLSWTMKDGKDVHDLINTINMIHNNGEDFTCWGGGEYALSDDPRIIINIMPVNENEYRIRIIKQDGYFDRGFFAAHKIYTPDLLCEMVLGLRKDGEIKESVMAALEP